MAKKTKTKMTSIAAIKAKAVELSAERQVKLLAVKKEYDDKTIELNHQAEELIDRTKIKLQEELKKAKTNYENEVARLEEYYN